jgi:hypothetical protein
MEMSVITNVSLQVENSGQEHIWGVLAKSDRSKTDMTFSFSASLENLRRHKNKYGEF